MKEILDCLKAVIPEAQIKLEEPMAKHTSFHIGGPADIYVEAKKIEEIQEVLKVVQQKQVPIYVIGNGSNLLVKDGGIRGIVLKIDLQGIQIKMSEEEAIVTVGAGVKLAFLAQKLKQESLTGFEFASGIPGTIGGAIRMNAGAHGGEMKDIVVESKYLDQKGRLHTISNEEHEFAYRNSVFCKETFILIETTLRLQKGNKEKIKEKMEEYANWRKEKQPLEYPSAGSTFKRGEDFITAKLIDDCGLKGYQVGGAQISEKHAGFVINKEKATANDIIVLIENTKRKIYDQFGKKITLEIEVIGEDLENKEGMKNK